MKLIKLVGLFFLVSPGLFAQTTIYVATTGNDSTGNGSVGNPYFSISQGVAQAVAGDTVMVNPGVYTQTVNVYITNDIIVRGMNAPTGVVITTMYPDVSHSTRCVRVKSAGAVFDGFTVEKGYPIHSSAHQYAFGGGMLVEAGLVTNCIIRNNQARNGAGAALWNSNAVMRNCWISNNACAYGASMGGGGIMFGDYYGDHGGASLLNCTIHSNYSPTYAGGVYSKATNGVISNCTISANYVSGTAINGGGIFVSGPGMLITDSIISNNASECTGGGICVSVAGYATIQKCHIVNNKTKNTGAGIHVHRSAASGGAMISNCVIEGNQAVAASLGDTYGAGISDGYNQYPPSSGRLEVVDTRIIGNGGTSCQFGGGAWIYTHGTALFHNCQIISNSLEDSSSKGAGIYVGTGSACVVIQNCRITDNQANYPDGQGGGLFFGVNNSAIAGPNPFDARVESCTIAGNSALTYYGGMKLTNGVSVFNCVVASNSAGTSYPDMADDAAFIALVHYSCSPVLTNSENGNITNAPGFVDYASGNYRLAAGSPCINAGTNQAWMSNAFDLDGRARIDRLFRKCDMGCYEHLLQGMIFNLR